MTETQYRTMLTLLRETAERVEAVEQRLSYAFPNDRDITAQIEHDLALALSPGASIRVFADD